MEDAISLAKLACLSVLCVVIGAGCDSSQNGDARGSGDDEDGKSREGCKYIAGASTQSFRAAPIPAGFFDFDHLACEAFGDLISYTGQPIDEAEYGVADTIVRRDGDPVRSSAPVGSEGSVGIDIAALSLVSIEPITVLCDGVATRWDVRLGLSETAAPRGTLTAVKEHANGGTAGSVVFVYPRLTFTCVDDPSVVRVLDTAVERLDPVRFEAIFAWSHAVYADDLESGSQFLVGIDSSPGAQMQRVQGADGGAPTCILYSTSDGSYVHEICPLTGSGTR